MSWSNFSQNTNKIKSYDSIIIAKTTLKSVVKKQRKCDSLRVAYNKQRRLITNFSTATLKLLHQNDSIKIIEKQTRKDYENINNEFIKQKSKKGISIFEGILIGVGAFGMGALIF